MNLSVLKSTPKANDFVCPELKDWDPTTLPDHFSMIIFGRRFSGKTFMMRHLVYAIKKRFAEVYLFSITARLDQEDYSYIPKTNRIYGLDEVVLQNILDEQEKAILHYNANPSKNNIPKNVLILMDDIITEDAIRNGDLFKRLYVLGRHLKISVITLTQSIGGRAGCPLVARDNCSAVISFFIHNENSRDQIIEQYASTVNKKQGDLMVKTITADKYTAIVFDLQNVNARAYEDYCYRYKCPTTRPNFMIGTKQFKNKSQLQIASNYGKNAFERFTLNIKFEKSEDGGIKDIVV